MDLPTNKSIDNYRRTQKLRW